LNVFKDDIIFKFPNPELIVVNNDILGGLKSALARGYSLEESMLSFLNGGYKREEIEEAAQALQMQTAQATAGINWSPQPIWASKQQAKAKSQAPSPMKTQAVQPKQVVTKGVAAYAPYDNSKIKLVTIILIIVLISLLGILGLMYLFKTQIIDFFNSLF